MFNYDDDYAVLLETWLVYQEIIDCYDDPNKRRAKTKMRRLIDSLRGLRQAGLTELAQLGRSLHKRRTDIWHFSTSAPPTARSKPSTGALNTSTA